MAHLIVSARLAVEQGGVCSEPFSLHCSASPAGTRAPCVLSAPAALQEVWQGDHGREAFIQSQHWGLAWCSDGPAYSGLSTGVQKGSGKRLERWEPSGAVGAAWKTQGN